MEESIFTKIINGDIPCYKIYEDERTIAFMDIHPVQKGHVLVVPKSQVDEFQELSSADYIALWNTVQKVSKRLKDVIKPKRIGIHIEGFDVPHAHVHVIPINHGIQDFLPSSTRQTIEQADLEELAKTLAF